MFNRPISGRSSTNTAIIGKKLFIFGQAVVGGSGSQPVAVSQALHTHLVTVIRCVKRIGQRQSIG